MSRLPGTPGAQIRKPEPDIYSALLLIGIGFLLVACVCVFMDLTKNYANDKRITHLRFEPKTPGK